MGMGPPRDAHGRFVNWAGTVRSSPVAWHEPASEDELCALVARAAAERRRVRVVGAGHSWSAIARVTIRVVPAFRLAETIENVPIADACARSEAIARSAEYVKIWWLPHTPLAQVYRYERTDLPATRRPSPETERWLDERVLHG